MGRREELEKRRAQMAAKRERLSETQRAMLDKLVAEAEPDPAETIPTRPNPNEDAPLSFAQQRLWFIHQLDPNSPFYNVIVAVSLTGPLQSEALERAVCKVVQRHQVLRTVFVNQENTPHQRILPEDRVPFRAIDLGGVPGVARDVQLQALINEETETPFDLEHGPLLRNLLIRKDTTEHILVVAMHHIVTDGWSMGIFVREVALIYHALVTGQPEQLPPLACQYADYAVWQRQWLSDGRLREKLAFWLDLLADAPPVLELPLDHARPAVQTNHGATVERALSGDLFQRINQFSAGRYSPFMVMLAAFQALLFRYSDQDDIVVGTPTANRGLLELEPLIGFFVNTLPLRQSLAGAPSFETLLERTQHVVVPAFTHQDIPFEKLVEELKPERDPSRSPIFQVMFVFQNAPTAGDVPDSELELTQLETKHTTTKYDLTLNIGMGVDSPMAVFEYNTDLFEATTITRMGVHFKTLLDAALADPMQPVTRLPILSGKDRRCLLGSWNGRDAAVPTSLCLTARVAHFADAAPDRPAMVSATSTQLERRGPTHFQEPFGVSYHHWTYAALQRDVNRLAGYLRHTRGLQIGDVLVVHLGRTYQSIVALPAAQLAGCAYLPLSPDTPEARLKTIIRDSRPALVLTRQPELFEGMDTSAVNLDAVWNDPPTQAEPPQEPDQPELPAYIIYTSGSTGEPKGVVIPKHGLTNLVAAFEGALDTTPGARYLQNFSMSFDASVWEIARALAYGGTLVQPPHTALLPGPPAARCLQEQCIDNALFTPSALMLLPELGPPYPREMVVCAEPCPAELPGRHLAYRTFYNVYGPTETSVWTHTAQCQADENEPPPIGRLVAGVTGYVMDRQGELPPPGVIGELFIGGPGLAQGYLNRPDLTAAAFVPNGFTMEPGGRLYRTGDLVRFRADGQLEFKGRRDNQIKLRGYRVEPDEVAAVLRSHPTVKEAMVLKRSGAATLSAFLSGSDMLDEAALRALCQDKLPNYMVPGVFVVLPRLPRLINDKIDLKALQAWTIDKVDNDQQAPREESSVEAAVIGVWRSVLARDGIGLDDNFFDLGGHSLLLAKVYGELKKDYQLEMVDLFRFPTVRTLANHLTRQVSDAGPAGAKRKRIQTGEDTAVAVIGLSCRFPDAGDAAAFWRNLYDGVESVRRFSDEEILAAGVPPELLNHPNYVKSGVVLPDIDLFDAGFFGMHPREAANMDPQHRLFLEHAWSALEDAGHDPAAFEGPIGVFAGVSVNNYLVGNLLRNPDSLFMEDPFQGMLGNDRDFLPTRIAYKLDLKGPAVNVQTACSTSLVAIHQAVASLLAGDCDMALAGGVSVKPQQRMGYLFTEGMIFSPDGHCRVFDVDAAGTIGGSGVGIVVLKRLKDALADGDHIRAVVKGSAINNDGALKVGFTAPGVDGQTTVIREALARAGVPAESIGYVEAHGTATPLGDPIEIAALTHAWREETEATGFCAVGSVKSNFGHADAAAGVAGFIKTVLALEHLVIPPSLNFREPNPKLNLESSPFYVNTTPRSWPEVDGGGHSHPARAGVSSFGIGGTNAHVILEGAPPDQVRDAGGAGTELLVLSAHSDRALKRARIRLAEYLADHREIPPADAAHTLRVGRRAFSHRLTVVASNHDEAVAALREPAVEAHTLAGEKAPAVVFMFPGYGPQHWAMAARVYQVEPVFREHFDFCVATFKPLINIDLAELVYAPEAERERVAARLNEMTIAQSVIFSVSYATAKLWQAWGVEPNALIGHSLGEYSAACLAGVFSPEDAMLLVATRSTLVTSITGAAALAVMLGEADTLAEMEAVDAGLELSLINGETRCVVSGSAEAVAALETRLLAADVTVRRIATEHPIHCSLLEPVLDRYLNVLKGIKLQAPRIRFISNVTGDWITAEQATAPDYWAAHMRRTVRFHQGLQTVLSEADVLLEVGPGTSLSSLAGAHPSLTERQRVFSSLPPASLGADGSADDYRSLLTCLGRLWSVGVTVDWRAFSGDRPLRRVPLPTYPFERERHWVEPVLAAPFMQSPNQAAASWFHAPMWKQTLAVEARDSFKGDLVIFDGTRLLGRLLAASLSVEGRLLRLVPAGSPMIDGDDHTRPLRSYSPEAFAEALVEIQDASLAKTVVFLWEPGVCEEVIGRLDPSPILMGLANHMVIGAADDHQPIHFIVVAPGMAQVLGDEVVYPETASAAHLSLALNRLPNVRSRVVDISFPEAGPAMAETIRLTANELGMNGADHCVAYRNHRRWVMVYESLSTDKTGQWRAGGVYLFTGLLESPLFSLTTFLEGAPTLILLDDAAGKGKQAELVKQRLTELLERGYAVVSLELDAADPEKMSAMLTETFQRYGHPNGVVHAWRSGKLGAELVLREWGLFRALDAALNETEPDFCCILHTTRINPADDQFLLEAADGGSFQGRLLNHNQESGRRWTRLQLELYDGGPVHSPDKDRPWLYPAELGANLFNLPHISKLSASEGIFQTLLSPVPPKRAAQAAKGFHERLSRSQANAGTPEIDDAQQSERAGEAHAQPRNEMEQAIALDWAALFGLPSVSVHDDFFKLGGDSLMATRAVSRLRKVLKLTVPIKALFEFPTIAGLAAFLGDAKENAPDTVGDEEQTIPHAPRDPAGLPLSFAQQRLWFIDKLEGSRAAYNVNAPLRLKGRLDVAALDAAAREIVARHEVLRTRFAEGTDGSAVQLVCPPPPSLIWLVDVTAVADREVWLQQWAGRAAMALFDLREAPLLRLLLIRLADEDHLLLATMHHIVSDGWSNGVLTHELSAFYTGALKSESVVLPKPVIQYADFSVWQRRRMASGLYERQLAYWRQKLAGEPALLRLPTDGAASMHDYSGAEAHYHLPAELMAAMKNLATGQNTTLFMVLLAGFKLLLHRLTGGTDIIVGAPIAGRNRAELEGLIGCFLNMLALRTDVAGEPPFTDLLARIKRTTLDAYANQDIPFERLVEEIQPERNLSGHPLFDVVYNFINMPGGDLEMPLLRLEAARAGEPEAKYAVSLFVIEGPRGIDLNLVYKRALFEAERVAVMLRQYHHLLVQIAASPTASLDAFSLIDPTSAAILPNLATVFNAPDFETAPALIQAHAGNYPEDDAVLDPNGALSYGAMLDNTDTLVRALLGHGFQPGDTVAVRGDRQVGLIVAMTAVLRAGGVLLMLDPGIPEARQLLMIDAAGARFLLRLDGVDGPVPKDLRAITFAGDTGLPLNGGTSAAGELPAMPNPDDPAYIFFTSGTTGAPKAVLGCHKGLSHFLAWQRGLCDVGRGDYCAQMANLSFDAVMREVFLPLTSGAAVCLPEADAILSPRRILSWLEQRQIAVAHAVPSLALSWLHDVPEDVSLTNLRWMFFVGEPLTDALVRHWRAAFPNSGAVGNLYGTTETTLAKSFYRVPVPPTAGFQPAGFPLPQTQLLVMDANLRPLGIGEPGEVVIRTPFRTLGYLDAPEESKRFVVNPVSGDARDLLYRTGDQGRFRPDGSLDIIGRIDHQLKLRGVRIDPSEVEKTLCRYAPVREAAVMAGQGPSGEKCLIAYLVTDGGDASGIRAFAREHLPEVMIPAALVILAAMPLTANGKLDRDRLPEPGEGDFASTAAYTAPRTPTEEILAVIWQEVLNIERVGVYDDFFDLGGHSLLATRVVSRIRDMMGFEPALRFLFEATTIEALATRLDATRRDGLQAPPIQPVPRESHKRHPLSFAQRRLWFLYQLEGPSATYNMPSVLHFHGSLQVTAMTAAVDAVVRSQDGLRTIFPEQDDTPEQRIAAYQPFSLPLVDLAGLTEAAKTTLLNTLIPRDAMTPFDLAQGPLFRIRLIRIAPDHHMLLMNMHHIISDGWSLGVMITELTEGYGAFLKRGAVEVRPLPIQYVDFAHWQQTWLQGEVLERQMVFWRNHLQAAPALLELPTDHRRPALQTFDGGHHSFVLEGPWLNQLHALTRASNGTLFMTLLAAFSTLLMRYSGQDDVVVGTPIANRNRGEVERLIGFFVNTLPLRMGFKGNPSFRDLAALAREVALNGYAHQDIPFEKIVEELHPQRALSHSPIFQVCMVLQNAPMGALALPGLQIEPGERATTTAKFDLNLTLAEGPSHLGGRLEFNTSLFRTDTAVRMMSHFGVLLEAAAMNPDRPVRDLPLMREDERRQVVQLWNDTSRPFPAECTVAHLFEQQADRTPEAVAVLMPLLEDGDDGTRELTYRDLEARANRLADVLRSRGIGPDAAVAVCLERSLDMVAALLGILKAGGAYLPIDPKTPAPRINFILKDAGVPLMITRAAAFEAPDGVFLLDPQHDQEVIAGASTERRKIRAHAENLAYVIYTSGSTGLPKGTLVPNHGVARLLFGSGFADLTAPRMLQLSSISFDLGTFEVWGPLLHGGCCILHPEAVPTSANLQMVIEKHRVDTAWLTASLFNLLVEEAPETFRGVKQLLVGGEALSVPHIRRAMEALPDTRFINGYGPTEATTFTCCYPIPADLPENSRSVPLGPPIANTHVHVLDARLNPMPVGVPGELLIGGPGLARGYLARPELTAACFIPNPFSGETAPQGDRLYKSGDLARYLPDGTLDYLGRTDHQIKLRGFRIELGEIEAALLQHKSVAEAAVMVVGEGGPERLVAYLQLTGGEVEATDTTAKLRGFLAKSLPDYMVPGQFLFLNKFPLTASGKLDRKALPTPDIAGTSAAAAFVPPEGETQCQIAAIWEELLSVERVGAHDNFFHLGGHSLIATQIVARLRRVFDVSFPLKDLFQAPTVAQLAELVDAALDREQDEDDNKLALMEMLEQMSEEEALEMMRKLEIDSL